MYTVLVALNCMFTELPEGEIPYIDVSSYTIYILKGTEAPGPVGLEM